MTAAKKAATPLPVVIPDGLGDELVDVHQVGLQLVAKANHALGAHFNELPALPIGPKSKGWSEPDNKARAQTALTETKRFQSSMNLFSHDLDHTELDCPVDWGNVLYLQGFYFPQAPQDFPHLIHGKIRSAQDAPVSWQPGQLKKFAGLRSVWRTLLVLPRRLTAATIWKYGRTLLLPPK